MSRDANSSQRLNSQFARGRHVEHTDVVPELEERPKPPMPAFDAAELVKEAPQRLKPIPKKQCTSDAWRSQ